MLEEDKVEGGESRLFVREEEEAKHKQEELNRRMNREKKTIDC